MSHRRKQKRCFYDLNDRRAKILDLTPASQAVVDERYKCSDHLCWNLALAWHQRPEPINVVVDRVTSAWVEKIGRIALMALDAELMDVLAPSCYEMFLGKVLVDRDGRPEPTRFVTVTATAHRRIQSDRGRFCRHLYYECCGVITNKIGWAGGAIVERSLDDRLVYIDQDGHVLVADELAEKLNLKRRFPKLRLDRIDVVPEPLDGEVLPGDPGWDGTFRPNPVEPMLPRMGDKRGQYTRDGEENETGEGWVTVYMPPADDPRLEHVPEGEIEELLVRAVGAAGVGEKVSSGPHPKKGHWHICFHGPSMLRLLETMEEAMWKRLYGRTVAWDLGARLKGGRERYVTKTGPKVPPQAG